MEQAELWAEWSVVRWGLRGWRSPVPEETAGKWEGGTPCPGWRSCG